MLRTVALVGLIISTVGGAVAGTVVPVNLTTSTVYMNTCNTANCTPNLTGTASTNTFLNSLFTAVYPGTSAPSPSSTPQNAAEPSTGTPFILAAQTGGDDQFLSSNAANMDTEISIDLGSCTGIDQTTGCGVSNVASLYTLLQGTGAFGYQGIVITVTGENSGGQAIDDTIDLTSGIDYRSTKSTINQPCDVANPSTTAPGTTCANMSSDTAQTSGTDSAPGGTLPGATVTVYNNAYGALQNSANGRNYYFDVQNIGLGGLFLNGGVLDSVSIENLSGSSATQVVFNGLSLNTATPEPGTFTMFGIGAGMVALWGIFSNRARQRRTTKN